MPRACALAATVVALLIATSACTATPQTTPSPGYTAPATGTVGAVDFSSGYITLGSGSTVVDSYFDLMCPYCQEFEAANGAQIAALVDDGTITLHLHPMVFLDRLSMGTEYSTRATNALLGVAVAQPDSTLAYLALLFENKPDENAAGLTDDELSALAAQATAGGTASVAMDALLRDRPYSPWAAGFTTRSMGADGITNADVTTVEHVPLTIVNGHSYTGGLSDSAAFAAFVAAS